MANNEKTGVVMVKSVLRNAQTDVFGAKLTPLIKPSKILKLTTTK
jgi:hypothetical protein